jgi:hypothetical protein
MNAYQQFRSSLAVYALAVLGSFLIVIVLVWAMFRYTHPAPISQNRVGERKKALAEIRNTEAESLNTYGWVDQSKGIVRLPISRAMELILQEYQNPAAARSNLVARAEKAAAAPPKAPEQPSKYE